MSTLNARNIFARVRGIINRIPVTIPNPDSGTVEDEISEKQIGTVVTGSGTIADEVLLHHLNHVVRYIVNACKVFHVITNSNEASVTTGPSLSDDEIKARVVHGTITRTNDANDEIRCRFRELGEHYDLEQSNRAATEEWPAYTYLDHDITLYPTPVATSFARYVISPSSIRPENMADLSDVLAVDNRFEGIIVAYVAAKAFRQIEEKELHTLWMTLFTRKLEPFLLGTRIGDPRTHLVSAIAYERENEIE